MKTIKIIDLLNKRANNEGMPRKISFKDETYLYNLLCYDYEDINTGDLLFEDRFDASRILNDEVEILDEADEFEDIDIEFESGDTAQVVHQLLDKIRPLIRNQKKILERLENENRNI